MQELKGKLPIERARMRLKVQVPVRASQELMQLLASKQATIESQDLGIQSNQVPASLPLPIHALRHLCCSRAFQEVRCSSGSWWSRHKS